MKPRWILHVDLDQFLASVELGRHPELVGLPVIVGGNGDPTEARKVVTCASYEAREFGVHAGMPLRAAARRCPEATFLPSDPAAYDAASEQVMALLRDLGHPLEVWGWDEAYLGADVDDPGELAEQVRTVISSATGLSCSVGISDNKQRAKVATGFAKPAGVYTLTESNWMDVMGERPVDALWGVGPKTTKKLAALDIATVWQLAHADAELLTSTFGPRTGLWLLLLANGGGDDTVSSEPWVPRSRSHVVTFPHDLTDRAEMDSAVIELAKRALDEVVAAARIVTRVAVTVRTATFYTRTKIRKLDEATTDADVIVAAALRVLDLFELDRPSAAARGSAGTADAGLTHPGYYRSRLECPRENHVHSPHRDAIRPPRNTFEQVQRADVHRGVDQEPVSGDAGQNLVGGLFRRYRVPAEPVDPAAHLRVVAVDAGDLDGVDQRRPHRTGHHHRHPDPMAGQVESQHFGESA